MTQSISAFQFESDDYMEVYELKTVRSSCGDSEQETAIPMREWFKRFPHYDVTKSEMMKLHFALTRFF